MLSRKGFTLIELLIVVAIIAILAAIAVPNFLEAQVRSKVSRAKSDLRTMITGLESYAIDHNKYPIPRMITVQGTNLLANDHSCGQFMPTGYHDVTFTPGGPGTFAGLTTPVSYLTSAFKDPFAVGKYDNLHDELGYQNIDFWVVANIGAAIGENGTAQLGISFKEIYGSYLIRSIGPDKRYDPVTRPYDPTNGTVSLGDVYRSAKRAKNNTTIGGE